MNASRFNVLRAFLLGGALPVLVFALVEHWYGTFGGVIAGVAFGVGEIIYEYFRFKKVQWITIAGNALVIGLGALSLLENNGVFFKLQPAILIFAFAGMLLGSSLLKRPFMVALLKKQRPDLPPAAEEAMKGINWRLGLCMIGIGILSVHAAYNWSTAAWAFLKGVGTPLILVAYMLVEVLVARRRLKR